jgi:hypothetical protein
MGGILARTCALIANMTNFTAQTSAAEELRKLLGAIHHTLAIDPPASAAADDACRRAFAHRAVLVHVTVDNFLRDPRRLPGGHERRQAARADGQAQRQAGVRALRASTRIG